jgi:hypothetical protein
MTGGAKGVGEGDSIVDGPSDWRNSTHSGEAGSVTLLTLV